MYCPEYKVIREATDGYYGVPEVRVDCGLLTAHDGDHFDETVGIYWRNS